MLEASTARGHSNRSTGRPRPVAPVRPTPSPSRHLRRTARLGHRKLHLGPRGRQPGQRTGIELHRRDACPVQHGCCPERHVARGPADRLLFRAAGRRRGQRGGDKDGSLPNTGGSNITSWPSVEPSPLLALASPSRRAAARPPEQNAATALRPPPVRSSSEQRAGGGSTSGTPGEPRPFPRMMHMARGRRSRAKRPGSSDP